MLKEAEASAAEDEEMASFLPMLQEYLKCELCPTNQVLSQTNECRSSRVLGIVVLMPDSGTIEADINSQS